MRLGSCPRLGDSLSVLSSCDVLVPTVHGHLLVLSPKVLCDSLIMSSYLTEEETNVRGGSLSEGRVGRFGLFLLIPPTTPLSPMPSAVLSLWSPIFPAISCPVCLTPHPVRRQVQWLAGWRRVGLAVFWGLFGKSGHWLVPMVLGPLWDPESTSAAPASISVSVYGIGRE